MVAEDLYAFQTSHSDMLIGAPGSVHVTDVLFPVNLILTVSLVAILCYGFYRRWKWESDNTSDF